MKLLMRLSFTELIQFMLVPTTARVYLVTFVSVIGLEIVRAHFLASF